MKYIISYLLKTMQVSGKKVYYFHDNIHLKIQNKYTFNSIEMPKPMTKRSHDINTSNRVCYKIFTIKSSQ